MQIIFLILGSFFVGMLVGILVGYVRYIFYIKKIYEAGQIDQWYDELMKN